MDAGRFETLLRSLAGSPSRRGAVRLLAGLILGSPLALASSGADAHNKLKKCKKLEDKGKRKKCVKKAKAHNASHTTPASPPCVSNCAGKVCGDDGCGGSCGVACAGGKSCQGGTCACLSGQTDCGGVCVTTSTDPRNCGACGKRCQLNATCNAGVCACVQSGCPVSVASCCPLGAGMPCQCADQLGSDTFINGGTCAVISPACPADYQTCIGPPGTCQACCPPGSTCDHSTGACLQ